MDLSFLKEQMERMVLTVETVGTEVGGTTTPETVGAGVAAVAVLAEWL
ncbi:hypothetical protein SAMN04488133_2023 [Halobellus limi]|uniref:Uncharacterized protein n=1 Tax=Halobellus limi TaxID=699433 RepID=A0A1H5ZL20_9EURY|nr:hypothetical protein SAMN04488133_2023 [Halobellus limi]